MTTRQQQRQQQRALVKRGQAVLAGGMPTAPPQADLVAFAFLLARTLRDPALVDRASEAAALAHRLCESSTRKNPGSARLACAKGCGYCCHTWVGATVPEVLLLARSIASDRTGNAQVTVAAVVERARPLAGKRPAERFGAKLACPLLVDNACSRYRDRPSVCRQATSLDLASCLDEYEGRDAGGEMPVSSLYLAHARNSRLPLMAALRVAELPAHTYELSEALSRVLATERAEARWLAGEDILAGAQRGPAEAPTMTQAVADLVAGLKGGQSATGGP